MLNIFFLSGQCFFLSQVLLLTLFSLSQYLSTFRQAAVLDPLYAYFWVLPTQEQSWLPLLCYWLPSLPCLFRPVSSYPKTPSPLPLCCLWSVPDPLWRPHGSHSLFTFPVQPLPPLPPTTTAWPPEQCVPPSWASQLSHIPAFTTLDLFENMPVSLSLSKAVWLPW